MEGRGLIEATGGCTGWEGSEVSCTVSEMGVATKDVGVATTDVGVATIIGWGVASEDTVSSATGCRRGTFTESPSTTSTDTVSSSSTNLHTISACDSSTGTEAATATPPTPCSALPAVSESTLTTSRGSSATVSSVPSRSPSSCWDWLEAAAAVVKGVGLGRVQELEGGTSRA